MYGFSIQISKYSRTSMARTLMAHLPWLFRTRSWVPWKKFHNCRFGIISDVFFFILKNGILCVLCVYCVYSLESPRWGDSNVNTQYTFILPSIYLHFKESRKDITILPPDLALLSTLIGSNFPCLELIFMVPKVFEPLKFDCTCNLGFNPKHVEHFQSLDLLMGYSSLGSCNFL